MLIILRGRYDRSLLCGVTLVATAAATFVTAAATSYTLVLWMAVATGAASALLLALLLALLFDPVAMKMYLWVCDRCAGRRRNVRADGRCRCFDGRQPKRRARLHDLAHAWVKSAGYHRTIALRLAADAGIFARDGLPSVLGDRRRVLPALGADYGVLCQNAAQ